MKMITSFFIIATAIVSSIVFAAEVEKVCVTPSMQIDNQAITSSAAYWQMIIEYYRSKDPYNPTFFEINDDGTLLLPYPTYVLDNKRYLFDQNSDPNQVCKLLGYKSSTAVSTSSLTWIPDGYPKKKYLLAKGDVSSLIFNINDSSTRIIDRIDCIISDRHPPPISKRYQKTRLISNKKQITIFSPKYKHHYSVYNFSGDNDPTTICNHYGYDSYVSNSLKIKKANLLSSLFTFKVVKMKSQRHFQQMEQMKDVGYIKEITCNKD